MKKYFQSLHTKSHKHKKRFALLASASITLAIFAVWSAVHFGFKEESVKVTTGPVNLAAVSQAELSTLENILSDIKTSWRALTHNGQ